MAESEVLRLMQALLDAGADRVSLADTVGFADPASVQRLFAKARALVGDRLACAHFHDTRGMGLANAYADWQTGITRFDACLAGIGGCPHAPGASGNVTTEDLEYMLQRMGVTTVWMCPRYWRCASAWRAGWQARPCTAPCGRRACPATHSPPWPLQRFDFCIVRP